MQNQKFCYLCIRTTNYISESSAKIYMGKELNGLTISKRPGTSYQIEIHFAVVNHLYLLFSFVNLLKVRNCLE